MVRAENVYKTFYTTHKIEALVDVSCGVDKGEVVVIIGPSGSGKSTILRCLNMLEKADRGHIYIDGVDILDPKTHDTPNFCLVDITRNNDGQRTT